MVTVTVYSLLPINLFWWACIASSDKKLLNHFVTGVEPVKAYPERVELYPLVESVTALHAFEQQPTCIMLVASA